MAMPDGLSRSRRNNRHRVVRGRSVRRCCADRYCDGRLPVDHVVGRRDVPEGINDALDDVVGGALGRGVITLGAWR
jgi:hypothetical protein